MGFLKLLIVVILGIFIFRKVVDRESFRNITSLMKIFLIILVIVIISLIISLGQNL
jgi:hypothetical protein